MVDKRKFQDRTIHSTTAKEGDAPRDSQADEHEVTQRAGASEPVGSRDAQASPAPANPAGQANTASPSHEQRENPGAGSTGDQAGTGQAHERPGVGNMRASSPSPRISSGGADRKAMSQNGARISDFEG
jgi:hypothetical protein